MNSDLDQALGQMFAEPASALATRITTRTGRRRFMDWSATSDKAEKLLRPLPRKGQTLHFLLGQNSFPLSAIVPAIVSLSGQPCSLVFSKLGIRAEVADEFCQMHKDKKILSITALLSCYFESADHDAAAAILTTFHAAGHRAGVGRTHAKVLLLRTKDAKHHFVIESSANLRSCKMLEQGTITDNRRLFQFHRTWINRHIP